MSSLAHLSRFNLREVGKKKDESDGNLWKVIQLRQQGRLKRRSYWRCRRGEMERVILCWHLG